ncbi:DUF3558 family protein [Gordonia jacobaea]|uniref:DUF3558 family protein n=1 Tax=Gordonia jacobaea TaxID=122202 RepID=UPI003D7608B7
MNGATLTAAAIFLLAVFAVSGCSQVGVVPGEPTSAAANPGESANAKADVRQTDEAGRPLPFTTVFPRRWSNGNDGTTYEPCTAADTTTLRAAGLDPRSARDAAIADHQTARGCRWSYTGSTSHSLTQIVGNNGPLHEYKLKKSTSFVWRPDTSINMRLVAVGSVHELGECTAMVDSGRAIVFTRMSAYSDPPPIDEICDKAIAFTRATIDQMPE